MRRISDRHPIINKGGAFNGKLERKFSVSYQKAGQPVRPLRGSPGRGEEVKAKNRLYHAVGERRVTVS